MRLPNIEHRKVTGAAGSVPSPATAVAESRQKQAILGEAFKQARDVSESHRAYELNKVNSQYADEMSDWRREASSKDVLSAGEIKAMGLDDVIDTQGREFIPKYEWYPTALERRMDETRSKYGGKIKSGADRNKWESAVGKSDNKMLESEVNQAFKEQRTVDRKMRLNDLDQYVRSGHYDSARTVLSDPMFAGDPEAEQMMNKINVTEERHEDQTFMQNASPEELRERAVEMRSKDYTESSSRSAADLASDANTMDSMAKVRETQATKEATKAYNAAVDTHWQNNWNDPSALVANMPMGLKDEDIRSIVNFASSTAGGTTVKTDVPTWDMIETMSGQEPDRFRDTNLLQYRDKLSTAQYQTFRQRQLDLEKQASGETDKPPSYQTDKSLIDTGLTRLGINPTGTSGRNERHEMTSVFARELEDAEAENQRAGKGPLTNTEKEQIIGDVVTYQYTAKGKSRKATPFEDMDSEDIIATTSALRTMNLDVTAKNADAIVRMQDKDIELDPTNHAIVRDILIPHGKVISEQSILYHKQELARRGRL